MQHKINNIHIFPKNRLQKIDIILFGWNNMKLEGIFKELSKEK